MFQKLCDFLTGHKFSKCIARTDGEDGEPVEYYYKCRICGYIYWNYTKPKNTPKWDK